MKEVQRLLAEAFELAKKEGVLLHTLKFHVYDVGMVSAHAFQLDYIAVDSSLYEEVE